MLALPSTLVFRAVYLVDLFQHKGANPSTLVLDIYLAELVPVCRDRADFPDGVLIANPVKEVVDPARRRLLERIVWVDIDHRAVPGKIRWSVGGSMEHEGRGIRRTLSIDLPSYSCVILWSPHKDP